MKKTAFVVLILTICLLGGLSFAGQSSKVTICHIPPGNPDNPQTITVSANALEAHLAHGDSLGECPNGCLSDATICDDGNLCTYDECLPDGQCAHTTVDCDDGNICTLDLCMETIGCLNLSSDQLPCDIPCDDGNACTEGDVCKNGTCAGTPIVGDCCIENTDCDDGNPCTIDSCIENTCQFEPKDCTVTDKCLIGFCDQNSGECFTTPVVCDDSNVCTDDTCEPAVGCVFTPTSSPPEAEEFTCDDNLDNDCDGLTDCDDSDCELTSACGGCPQDAWEPNDTPDTATDLGSLHETSSATPRTLTSCHTGHPAGYWESPSIQPSETDNTALYFVQVVRKPQFEPQCDYYSLEFKTGSTNYHTVTGNISPEGDSDWYKVVALDTVTQGEWPQWECPEEEVCVNWVDPPGYCIEYGCPVDLVNTADEDPWTFEVNLIDNPNSKFAINVYKGGPPGVGAQVCTTY